MSRSAKYSVKRVDEGYQYYKKELTVKNNYAELWFNVLFSIYWGERNYSEENTK